MDLGKNAIYLSVVDHSVSKETFTLLRDDELDLLITTPKPNDSDLGKYYESDNYISHTDGSRSLFERVYQLVKRFSLKRKLSLVYSLHRNKGKLLDIGAGTGDFLALAQKSGWDAMGFEPNDKAREIAKSKGVHLTKNTSDLPDNSIDLITMWHVLEHVPDVNSQIKELKRLIKPNGTIIIAVPNFNSYDAKKYGEFWAAFDVPRHLWHFSKTAIKRIFESEGINLVKTLPMKFDSYYVALLSEKYKTGKMNVFNAFVNGWTSNRKGIKSLEYSSHIYVLKPLKN